MKNIKEILNIMKLNKSYSVNRNEQTIIIHDVSFKIEAGRYYSIMGKSGCGKTTLLKLLGGIEKPTSGNIYFMGKEINSMKGDELADFKRCHVGFIYQDYRLLSNLTVEENIILPLVLDENNLNISLKKVKEMGEQMKISHLMKRSPIDLSGGEKQRVAISRALINNPDIILADEPTGNLDSIATEIIVNIFKEIHETMKKTLIIVTHDAKMASYSEKVMFLKDGKIPEILDSKDSNDFYNDIVLEMAKL